MSSGFGCYGGTCFARGLLAVPYACVNHMCTDVARKGISTLLFVSRIHISPRVAIFIDMAPTSGYSMHSLHKVVHI